jgi:hypothetical protein
VIRQPIVRAKKLKHRGRHQAQGHDIKGGNESSNWAQGDPYPAATGHTDLSGLERRLGQAAQLARDVCFRQAHQFIDRCRLAGGIGPVSPSFPAGRPNEDTDIRVDIVVDAGTAFV